MNAPLKSAEPETVYAPAVFTDDEFENLIGEFHRIGRFELRDWKLYRVNTRQNPDAASDPVYTPAEFTNGEFEALIGPLGRIGRFELRDWKIYRMNAEYVPHMRTKMALIQSFFAAVAAMNLDVGSEGSIDFGGGFAPDPDIFLWQPSDARKAVPGDRVHLVVEVSDTSLADDLGSKRDLYARAGLPEYWVVDLNARVIHLFAAPKDGAFTRAGQVKFGDKVAALTLPSLTIDTAALTKL